MKCMLIGVIAFVLVIGAVILSLYFGMEMSKDNFKEYQAIFVNDFGEVVHENVIVTEKEELFSNDEATDIADFSTITFKKRIYDITDIWLNNKALGIRSAKLCKDKVAFFLRVKQELTTKVKRAVNTNIARSHRLHCFMPGFAPLIYKGTTTPQN